MLKTATIMFDQFDPMIELKFKSWVNYARLGLNSNETGLPLTGSPVRLTRSTNSLKSLITLVTQSREHSF